MHPQFHGLACTKNASLPESVHSERIPTFTSIFVTLSQVLKSSSTTNALRPSSSAIFLYTALLRLDPQWKTDYKFSSFALLCPEPQWFPHHIHNILGNGHAKPGALSPANR